MRTTTRKPTVIPPMPFHVPPPFDKMLQNAAEKVEEVAGQTRQAASRLEKPVRSAASTVRKRGEIWAKDPASFAVKVTKEASKEANRIADEVTSRVTDAVEGVIETSLHKMNVPTLDELQSLNRKVDLLSRKIDGMAGARKPAARRTVRRPR